MVQINFNAITPVINRVPDLKEGNFHLWDKRILDFFVIANLRGIHPGHPDKPTETEALAQWNAANDTLKPYIALKVGEEHLYLIDSITTVKGAYDALKLHFQRSTMGSRMAARQELYRVVHNPSSHISAYFHAVETARGKLSGLGITLDDKEIVDVILMNLDASLHGARTALLTSKDEPDLKTVKDTLNGATSSTEPIVKIEGAMAARSFRPRTDGISDSRGNTWCNTRSNGCHRCGRQSHQAYRCTTDMPPEVKSQVLQSPSVETAAAAAALAPGARSYTEADFNTLAAALSVLTRPESNIWAHDEEETAHAAARM